ncbi:hypothetical protein PSTT_13434 [Puccinia striiformis]|uniref:Uncharacterized protein n=1 Tax=Puccinia striiformis TaxID=27350 RepID=A0A2S4URY6_9BASI|nr:hypothetical protein PSTT_13434 [Puccinia striiformis]
MMITNPTRVDKSFRPGMFIRKRMLNRIHQTSTKKNDSYSPRKTGHNPIFIDQIWEFNSRFGQIWYSYWFRLAKFEFQSFIQEIIIKSSSFEYNPVEFFSYFLTGQQILQGFSNIFESNQ